MEPTGRRASCRRAYALFHAPVTLFTFFAHTVFLLGLAWIMHSKLLSHCQHPLPFRHPPAPPPHAQGSQA